MADFIDQYIANHLISGMSKDIAIDAAEASTGQHCVAELARKARTMAALFQQYHDAGTNKGIKQRVRRAINKHVEELYAEDTLCEECMTWLRARIMDVVPVRPRKDFHFSNELSCWYEVAEKMIRKSGCDKCPWHKRENAEWQARISARTPKI